LFSGNERAITYINTGRGMAAVIKVGAMNVGKITLSYADEKTNRFFGRNRDRRFDKASEISINKGDEVGMFHLGSTVILLFEKGFMKFEGLETGNKVRLGQVIGRAAG
jgi:phosphatidylserine decarboxylase